jgi:ubiquinone/menaquinone biosynthesis C-methylase UbiE
MSQQGQWQVAGNAADVYERELVPAVFASWAPFVVALAAPQSGERVLDVACGTGVVARLAAQRVGGTGQVVGLDLNPGMLAVAAVVAPPASPTCAPITWREASAMAMPLADAAFDIVYCQLGLQFFADRATALHEMYRMLVPGGRLALMVWRTIQYSPGFGVLAAALERHVSTEAAAIMRAPFALGEAEELQTLLVAAGFRDVVIRPETGIVRFPSATHLVQSYVAGSPLAGHVAKATEEARTALLSEVRVALQSYVSESGLTFPIEAHLASARK